MSILFFSNSTLPHAPRIQKTYRRIQRLRIWSTRHGHSRHICCLECRFVLLLLPSFGCPQHFSLVFSLQANCSQNCNCMFTRCSRSSVNIGNPHAGWNGVKVPGSFIKMHLATYHSYYCYSLDYTRRTHTHSVAPAAHLCRAKHMHAALTHKYQ